MFHELTPEEEREHRGRQFAKLRPGSLFNLSGRRHFIAVEKRGNSVWIVVELDRENRMRLVQGKVLRFIPLVFCEMRHLNVLSGEAPPRTVKRFGRFTLRQIT